VAELTPGDVFAGCRIDGLIGRGGMGVIYRAWELRLGRPVAVKLIVTERASDPEFRERFEREARLTASIDHPNVIPVYAAGEERGHLYLVMRFVAGTDLHALLARDGPLEPRRAAAIVAQVASALDAAHAAGLVHRDVKPGNVLLSDGHVYLSDFGITRVQDSETQLTTTGSWVGTVDFMAPEHLGGERLDARADVYALGCVLHAALTGAPPFRRDTVPATILAHLHDPPPRPSDAPGVPARFDEVVGRALAKDPARRHPSAGDLARAAVAAATGAPPPAPGRSIARGPAAPDPPTLPAPPPDRGQPGARTAATRVHPSRRRRVARGGAALLAVAAAVAGALALTRGGEPPPAGDLTRAEVREVADAFARAYAGSDRDALRRLLTPGVRRVAPDGVQRGREAVLAEYGSQFEAYAVEDYRLEGLVAEGGPGGRASARYRVERAGEGAPITGRLVLGVVREGTQPRIELVAAEPRG
jgi:predicted Ser/Thr protein kinase